MTIVHNALEVMPVHSDVPMLDTGMFAQMQRAARAMAAGSLIPQHLKVAGDEMATQANCLRVINQAYRWQFDPFAVMDQSFVIGGKLGFQGQLVLAAVNTHAPLKERLHYAYKNSGDDRTIQITGTFKGESKAKSITVRVGDVRTKNQMWDKDPDQKLIYTGVVKWARAHCPEIIMGVTTMEDIEGMQERGELRAQVDGTYAPTAAERPTKPEYAAAAPQTPQKPPYDVAPVDEAELPLDGAEDAPTADGYTLLDHEGAQVSLYLTAYGFGSAACQEFDLTMPPDRQKWLDHNADEINRALPNIGDAEISSSLARVLAS